LDNIIETFAADVAEENEKGQAVFDPEVNAAMSIIIMDFLNGTLRDRRAFDAAVEAQVLPILERKGYNFGGDAKTSKQAKEAKGMLYAHNFFEIAQGYKDYVKAKIEDLVREFGPENMEAIQNHIKGLVSLEIQLGLKERDIRETKPQS